MSADNGVYILKMKDQYRVSDFCAADNLFYSKISGETDILQPLRIVEHYKDAACATKAEEALSIAYSIRQKLPVCEYGIQMISVDKTWEEILMEAQKEAKEEQKTISESFYYTRE